MLIKGYRVRCGRCFACRKARAMDWTIRLLHECSQWQQSVFLTLTYNDDSLPLDYGLEPRALQKLIKRVRKECPNRKIKYYLVGEYGDELGRPHYHLIVFGHSDKDVTLWEKEWKCGFVHAGSVEDRSIRYVSGYVQKKLFGKLAKQEYGEREPPFMRCSQGIGKGYMDRYEKMLRRDEYVTVNGYKHTLPKYYVKKLELDPEERVQRGAQAYEAENSARIAKSVASQSAKGADASSAKTAFQARCQADKALKAATAEKVATAEAKIESKAKPAPRGGLTK